MDRTPSVFEEKIRWKLDEAQGPGAHECNNYASIDEHFKEVEQLFREEESLGWMVEMSDEDAKRIYGERLFIASLAVVQELGKVRVVHDGSNGVHVNHRIRPRDQGPVPRGGGAEEDLEEQGNCQ